MECFSHLVQIIGETCYRVLSNILEHSYILSLTLLLIDPIQFSSIATSYFFHIIGMLHIYVFQSVFFFLSLHFLTFTEAAAAPLSSCTNNGTFKCGTHFQCGNLSGIGYPFWGNNRPSYCGKPDFELSCFQENITEIQINSKTYRVLDVIQEKQTLRIARMDFWNDACPSPLEDTSSLNSTVFNYLIPSTKNLSLYYDCPVSAVTDPTLFTCVDAARISDAYFVNESVLPVQGKRHLEACKVGIQVPVIDKALKSLLSGELAIWEVFREGFDVVYYDATKEFDCSSCEMSGGECGYDLVNQKSVCFPHDRDDKTKCAPNPNGTAAQAEEAGVASHGVRVTVKIGIVMSVVGALVIAAGGITFYVLKKKKTKNSENLEEFLKAHGALAPKRYKYSEVRKMTEGFQDKLGQGGYGSVYKGKLPDGRMVAVKLLDEAKGNGDDFINEVASISRTSHVNVVALLGFCVEGSKRALVYEFVPNGSLEKFIYLENPQLGWETLYKIAIGIARGLEYLHRGCYTRILHFDIKPHNILLDQDFSPKISDFGLAKLSYGKESIVSMTRARGTVGYIAPEVVSRNFGGVSYKADVYSYGMMVLEMVGGRKNLDPKVHNPSEIYFPTWIYKRLNLNEDLGLHEVTNAEEEEIARKMIIVGLSCIQNYPSDRPAMSGVLEMLEGKVEALQIPPKLFESSPTSREQEDTSPTISIS